MYANAQNGLTAKSIIVLGWLTVAVCGVCQLTEAMVPAAELA